MRGVAHHIRVPKSAAGQLAVKLTAESCSSSSFDGSSRSERWRTSAGARSSRLNSFPESRDLDSISWDSSLQLRHVALVPSFYPTKPNIISFHQTDPLAANGNYIR